MVRLNHSEVESHLDFISNIEGVNFVGLDKMQNWKTSPTVDRNTINPILSEGYTFTTNQLDASIAVNNPFFQSDTTYNYENVIKGDFAYLGRGTIPFSFFNNIRDDLTKMNSDSIRISGHDKFKELCGSIDSSGYDLSLSPPVIRVYEDSNGNFHLAEEEGRHRIYHLGEEIKTNNFIADFVYIENDSDARRVSMWLNATKPISGSIKKADALNLLNTLVSDNSVDGLDSDMLSSNKNPNWIDYHKNVASPALEAEMNRWSNDKLAPSWITSIIATILEERGESKVQHYRRFESGNEKDVKAVVAEWGYKDIPGQIEYKAITPKDAAMVLGKVSTIMQSNSYDPNVQYRILFFLANPSTSNPEKDWLARTECIASSFLTCLTTCVNGRLPDNIVLYGAPEQVRAEGMEDHEFCSVRRFDSAGRFVTKTKLSKAA